MQQQNECRIMKFVKKMLEVSGEQLIHKLQKHNKAKVIFSRFCKYLYLWIEKKKKRLWPHCEKEKSITSNVHLQFIIAVKLTWTLMTSESPNLLMNHLIVWFEISLTRWFVWAHFAKEKFSFLFMIIFLMFYNATF